MPLLIAIMLLMVVPPEPQPPKPLLLLNGTVHLGNGTTLPNAALAITEDSISLLGDARVLRMDMTYFEVVGVFGNHIYPGQVVDSSNLVVDGTMNSLAVRLDSGRVLIPRSVTNKVFSLREGMPATLLVTDTLIAADTHPRVLRAFVNGQAVALPDSPDRKCLH